MSAATPSRAAYEADDVDDEVSVSHETMNITIGDEDLGTDDAWEAILVLKRQRDDARTHAASLTADLDDAGATISDYRDALCVMQAERDKARAQLAAPGAAAINTPHGAATVLRAQPGDILVVAFAGALSDGQARELYDRWGEYGPDGIRLQIVSDIAAVKAWHPADAPRELAAAMAEARQLRELVREICGMLVSQKYPAARVAPWLKRAGLEPAVVASGKERQRTGDER